MDSRSGTSILMLQIEKGDIQSVKQCLIQHPGLLNKQNNSGNSPLTIAIRINNLPIISTLLLQPNSQINLRNKAGQTPLFIATFQQKISAVQLLLSFEADPSIPDFRGWTPLMVAVSKGNKDIVLELLSRGNYGVFFRNSLGESVFDLAKTKDMLECLMQGSGLKAEEIESNLGQSVLCSLRGKLAVCPADVDVKVNSVNRAVMRVQKSLNSATKNHKSSKQLEKMSNSSNILKPPMNHINITQNSHMETRKLKQALEDISRVNRRLEDRFTSEKQPNNYFLNESCSRSGIKQDASYSSNKYDNSEDSKSKYYDASNSSSSFSNKKSRSSHKKNCNENDESSFLQGQQQQIIGGMSPLSSNKSSNSFFSSNPNQRKQQQIFQQQQQTATPSSQSQMPSAQHANLPKTSSNNSSYLVFPGNVTSDSTTSSNSQKQLRQQILLTPPGIQRNNYLQPPPNHSSNNNNNLSYLSNGSNSETASSSYNLGHNNAGKMHQPDTNILQPSSPSFISSTFLKNDYPEKQAIGNSIADNNHMDYMNLTSSEIIEKTSQRVLLRMAEIALTSVESMDQQFGMGVRTFLQQAVNNVNLTMLEKMKVLRTFEEQTIQEFAEQNIQDIQEQRNKQILIGDDDNDEQIEQLLPLAKEHSPTTISNEVIMFQAKNPQSRYQIDGIVEQPTLEMIETPPTQGQSVQSLLLKKFSSQKQLESQRVGKMNSSKMSQKESMSVSSESKGQWNFKGIDLESDYRFEYDKDQQNQEQSATFSQNNGLSRKIIKNTQLSHLANQQEITFPACQAPQNTLLNSQGIQRNSHKISNDLKNAQRGFLTVEKQKKVINGSGSKTNNSYVEDKKYIVDTKTVHRSNNNGQYFQELLSPKDLPDQLKIPVQRSAQTFPSHLKSQPLKYSSETHQKQRGSHGFLSVQLNQLVKEGTLPIHELQAQEDRNSLSSRGRNYSDFSLSPARDISLSPPRNISPCDHEQEEVEDHEQFEEDEGYDGCFVEVEENNKIITNHNSNNTHSQTDNLTLSPPRKISSSPKQSSSSESLSKVSEGLKNTITSQISVKNNDQKAEKDTQNNTKRATLTQENKELEMIGSEDKSFQTPSCSSQQSSALASQIASSQSLKANNLFQTQLEQTGEQFLTESKKPVNQDQDVIHSAIMKRLETMQKTLNAKLFQINSRKESAENSESNSNSGKV